MDTDVADRYSIELVNHAPSVKRRHLAVPRQALAIVRDYTVAKAELTRVV